MYNILHIPNNVQPFIEFEGGPSLVLTQHCRRLIVGLYSSFASASVCSVKFSPLLNTLEATVSLLGTEEFETSLSGMLSFVFELRMPFPNQKPKYKWHVHPAKSFNVEHYRDQELVTELHIDHATILLVFGSFIFCLGSIQSII